MLEVQNVAIEMAVAGQKLAAEVQKHDARLADQLSRSTTAVVLNLSEGIGRRTVPDKRNKYDIAMGECRESRAAAMLAAAFGYTSSPTEFLELSDRTGAMLYRLRRALDRW